MTTEKRCVNWIQNVLEQLSQKKFLLQLKRHVKILCYNQEYMPPN